ncbi:MAG: hypothetical protein Q9165_004868 [Trypethelium subeluteriae]
MVSSASVPPALTRKWKSHDPGHQRTSPAQATRLNAACDSCRNARLKCKGGLTCERCQKLRVPCHYSLPRRRGRKKEPQNNSGSPQPRRRSALSGLTANEAGSSRNGGEAEPPSEVHQPASVDIEGNLTLSGAAVYDADLGLSTDFPLPLLDFSSALTWPPAISGHNSISSAPNIASGCACLSTQLRCIADLCGPGDDAATLGLDGTLQRVRNTLQRMETSINCTHCVKSPTNLILVIISFQRIASLLCAAIRSGAEYLTSSRIVLGNFEPSSTEELEVKKLLMASVTRDANDLLSKFGQSLETVRGDCESAVLKQSDLANLKWVQEMTRLTRSRFQVTLGGIQGI